MANGVPDLLRGATKEEAPMIHYFACAPASDYALR
jgi:hypothetical protein